jgi:hypothetical protein
MSENIYESLRASHKVQRSLCRKLLRAKEDMQKRAMLRELRIELAAHAAAEERYLYAPILMDDMGLNSSRHALHEHHEIDECIEDFEGVKPSSARWDKLAHKLSEEVHHHLSEEEKKFFQVSGKILSDKQKQTLARRYEKDYERLKKKLSEH